MFVQIRFTFKPKIKNTLKITVRVLFPSKIKCDASVQNTSVFQQFIVISQVLTQLDKYSHITDEVTMNEI